MPGRRATRLHDAKSLANWFSNWFYWWVDARGNLHEALILKAWLEWQYRRQYRGLRFCPEPEGAPDGVYNSYYGFTVEPKPGSWKRLLGHIYHNVCRRDAVHFRFFIAWLAQLVQQPHIKPGTNIAMKGKEGVGKSKVGEWVVALFGRNCGNRYERSLAFAPKSSGEDAQDLTKIPNGDVAEQEGL